MIEMRIGPGEVRVGFDPGVAAGSFTAAIIRIRDTLSLAADDVARLSMALHAFSSHRVRFDRAFLRVLERADRRRGHLVPRQARGHRRKHPVIRRRRRA